MLIAFFVIEGIVTIMYAIDHRAQLSSRWGWMLASGVVDLILAGIIFAGLPGTAAWALGLLVGINMVFGGTAMIGMALAAKQPASLQRGQRPCPRQRSPTTGNAALDCAHAGRLARALLTLRNDDYSAGCCTTRVFSTPLAISAINSTAIKKPSAMTAVASSTRSKPPRP